MLKCSRTTLHRLVHRGELAKVYVCGDPRFTHEDIQAYIARRRIHMSRR